MRSALAASRRHHRPQRPGPLPGATGSWGEALGSQAESLERWPLLSRAHPIRQVLPVCPYACLPAAASMRGASRGLQIPGVRGARPAPPARRARLRRSHTRPRAVRLRCPGDRDFRAGPGPQGAPPSCGEAGRGGRALGSAAATARAQQPASPTAARPPPRAMAGSSSLEAVRRKIRSLQEQADAAEERAGSLQRELDYERKLRETVRDPHPAPTPTPITPPLHVRRRLLARHRPPEPTDPFPHAPGRTLAEGAGSPCACFSVLPFHVSGLK